MPRNPLDRAFSLSIDREVHNLDRAFHNNFDANF